MRQREHFTGPVCRRCESPIDESMQVCQCGAPTQFMSFQERNAFEAERYKAWKEAQQATA